MINIIMRYKYEQSEDAMCIVVDWQENYCIKGGIVATDRHFSQSYIHCEYDIISYNAIQN